MVEKNDSRSLLMLTGSMFIFGSIGIFRRFIPMSSSFLVFMRGIIGSFFLVAFLKVRRKGLHFDMGKRKLLLIMLTGAVLGINWMLLFEAYNYTTVGIATMCYYMEPVIIVILSPVLFKERLSLKKIICVLVAIAGMFFVAGASEKGLSIGSGDMKGILFGLSAAFFYALVVILNKKLSDIGAYEKTVVQLLAAAAVMIPYVIISGGFSRMELDFVIVVMVLIVGVVHTGMAYILYVGSMPGLRAQSIGIISYLDPVTALILSWLILGESMTVLGMVGAVMVLGAAFISEIIKD